MFNFYDGSWHFHWPLKSKKVLQVSILGKQVRKEYILYLTVGTELVNYYICLLPRVK